MTQQTMKKIWLFIWFLSIISCSVIQRRHISRYCPYAIGDHLEYRNHWLIRNPDGHQEKSDVFTIYEVLDISGTTDATRVKLKRYYTDINGTVEDSVLNFYTRNKLIMVRPDLTKDSLAFALGHNAVQTLEDKTDSNGIQQIQKIEDTQTAVTTANGNTFKDCLKLVTYMYDTKISRENYIYQKTSYYKDTILIKYSSIDYRQRDEGIAELRADSELESYHIYAWR